MTSKRPVLTGGNGRRKPRRVFRHFVVFTMKSGADIQEALRRMAEMCDHPTALHWEVAASEDTRKGEILIEWIDFASEADFAAFKASAGHAEWVEYIVANANWVVVDYWVDVP